MSDQPPRGTPLFRIDEPDLAELERVLPQLMSHAAIKWGPRERTQWRRVMEIVQNVRWGYGPWTDVTEVPLEP